MVRVTNKSVSVIATTVGIAVKRVTVSVHVSPVERDIRMIEQLKILKIIANRPYRRITNEGDSL